MSERTPAHRLEAQGIETGATVYWNLTTAPLVEQAIARGEGQLAKDGPMVVETGKQKLLDTGGRVERFQRRLEKAGQASRSRG